MALTYVAIATVTVGSGGANTITFNSIPNTYTDLLVYLSVRSDVSGTGSYVSARFNGTASIYQHIELYAENPTPESAKDPNQTQSYLYTLGHCPGNTATANTFSNNLVYIPNYAASNNKSVSAEGLAENNSSTNGNWTVSMTAGFASLASAISSITFTLGSNASQNFMQYSTATLYGIKNTV